MSKQSDFFDDPLEDYKPKPLFPFDNDWRDEPEDFDDDWSCSVCTLKASDHSVKQLVECALMELRHSKRGVKS